MYECRHQGTDQGIKQVPRVPVFCMIRVEQILDAVIMVTNLVLQLQNVVVQIGQGVWAEHGLAVVLTDTRHIVVVRQGQSLLSRGLRHLRAWDIVIIIVYRNKYYRLNFVKYPLLSTKTLIVSKIIFCCCYL